MTKLTEFKTEPQLSDYIDRYFDVIIIPQTKIQMESDLKKLELIDETKKSESKESKDCKHYLKEMLRINFPVEISEIPLMTFNEFEDIVVKLRDKPGGSNGHF